MSFCANATAQTECAQRLVSAAIRFYGACTILSVVADQAAACPFAGAVPAGERANILTIVDPAPSAAHRRRAASPGAGLHRTGQRIETAPAPAPAPGAVDIIHLQSLRPGRLARYFPLLSADGILIANHTGDQPRLKREAACYADEHDLIAICQDGSIALSHVDVVALLNLAAVREETRAAAPVTYSAAFGTA